MNNFDSKEYIKEVSEDIVSNFDKASRATTPSLKGASREHEIRKNLENLLPSGVGIGSGCIIDYKGNVSKQQDIVIYEKDICPIFSINNTPEATYYPCEGVIAVGEIKSNIGKSEIVDSFAKIESVKKLKRLTVKTKSQLDGRENMISFRKYRSLTSFSCAPEEDFNQELNWNDKIYGFILCGDFSVKIDTLNKHISNQINNINKNLLPNIIVSLHKGIYYPYNKNKNSLVKDFTLGNSYLYGQNKHGNFEFLLTNLHQIIRQGRTVEVSVFEHYIIKNPNQMQLTNEKIVD